MIGEAGFGYRFTPQTLGPELTQEPAPQKDIFNVPQNKDLAYVQGLTSNYYNSYGRLKDFTNEVWSKYGIDVTKPNLGEVGGGQLHKAYKNMEAELMMASNDLAQQREFEKKMSELEAQGQVLRRSNYDPNSQLAGREQEAPYMSTQLLPEVEDALTLLDRQYTSKEEAARATKLIDPLRSKLQNLIKTDSRNAGFYQRQLDALHDAGYGVPPGAYDDLLRQGSLKNKRIQGATETYKMGRKFNSDMSGFWNPDRVEYKTVDGQSVATVKPETSLSFGFYSTKDPKGNDRKIEKLLDYYYQDSKGRVYAKFDNSTIPDERVDNKSADEKVRIIYENNPRIGDAAKWSQAGEVLRTEYGNVDESSLYEPTELETLSGNREKIISGVANKDRLLQDTKKKLNDDINTGTDISYTVGDNNFKFKPHKLGSGFYLTKEEYTKLTGKKPKTSSEYEHLTADKIIQLLDEAKFFDTVLNSPIKTDKPKSKFIP